MSEQNLIPCVKLPEPEKITVPLPFGTTLQSVIDASKGPPTDCTLATSLILQIMPMLSSMECLFRILKALNSILEVGKAVVEFPPSAVSKLGDAVAALEDLSECFLMVTPLAICPMVKGILEVILAYLNCMISAFDSIWNFQLGIDLNAANGNPVLLDSLVCAQENAQISFQNTMSAMEVIEPMISMANNLMSVAGMDPIEFEMPDMSAATPSLADVTDEDPIEPVRIARDAIQAVHDALPC
jgi:hypothetical protein